MTAFFAGCGNTPYPWSEAQDEVVYYAAFDELPRDLDPQRSYTADDGLLLSLCYEGLYQYDYLKRPIELIPELATAMPDMKLLKDDRGAVTGVLYQIAIQEDVFFIDDPCFPGGKGREVSVKDFEYAFKRVADAEVNNPVFESIAYIRGMAAFRERIAAIRKASGVTGKDKGKPGRTTHDMYAEAGSISGIRLTGSHSLDVILREQYPQIVYWLAMRFISAVPHEAVDYYYEGRDDPDGVGPQEFDRRPVGTGPFYFKWDEYSRAKMVLQKNEKWWPLQHPERRMPGTVFPLEPGEPSDVEKGFWNAEVAGKPLPFVDRLEFYLEKEMLPKFSKFIQGYYDRSSVPTENFNQVFEAGQNLSGDMKAKAMTFSKDAEIGVFYVGFNMEDDQVGAPEKFKDPALEANRDAMLNRNKKLRQAMSLAINTEEYLRIFFNGLGLEAQSPLPPGIPGYDPAYRNPYRIYDPELKRAKQLLVEAGYPDGKDPASGKPLTLSFDVGSTVTRLRTLYNWFIDKWEKLGINVELNATDYNQFQNKMYSGSYQIFSWGWLADYPDPENFLFLNYGPNSARYNQHNPNHARYESKEYDFYFEKMENLPNEASASWTNAAGKQVSMTRPELIIKCRDIFVEDCAWIPTIHRETYLLANPWVKYAKPHPITGANLKHYEINRELRSSLREKWNEPVVWPAIALVLILVVGFIPACITVRKERR
jgi:ABC-type transport system substrate-binding protein